MLVIAGKEIYKRIAIFSLFLICDIIFLISSCFAESNLTTIEKYFAITKGNIWSYKIRIIDDNKKESSTSEIKENISVQEITSILKTEKCIIAETKIVDFGFKKPVFFYTAVIDNKVYIFNLNASPGFESLKYDLEDLAKLLEEKNNLLGFEKQIFSYPIEIGQIWQSNISGGTYTVEKQEDVTVPAGEFKNCFQITFKTKFYESTDWFCPGVGFVKIEWRNTGQYKTSGVNELVECSIK